MNSLRNRVSKIIPILLSSIVITLIFLAGPAGAISIKFTGLSQLSYQPGESIEFEAQIEVHSSEIAQVQSLALNINNLAECTFNQSGQIISGCDGVTIALISNNPVSGGSGYGYGYGYASSDSILTYKFTIETPQSYLNIPGKNTITLTTNLEDQKFTSEASFNMQSPSSTSLSSPNNSPKASKSSKKVQSGGIVICHNPVASPTSKDTIIVKAPSLNTHLEHGDYLGPCEEDEEKEGLSNSEESGQAILLEYNSTEASGQNQGSRITGAVIGTGTNKGARGALFIITLTSLILAIAFTLLLIRLRINHLRPSQRL